MDRMEDEQEERREFSDEELEKHRYLVNTCDHYYEEYKDCESLRARLHQRFVHGEEIDCSSRKDNYENCTKWRHDLDIAALNAVTSNEMRRRLDRIKTVQATSQIWELREEPPPDSVWRPPLPSYLQDKVDKSTIGDTVVTKKVCVLM